MSLFRIRTFTVGIASSGMMSFAMMGSLVFLPLFFQLVEGLSPVEAGLMMLPQICMMVISSIIGGRTSSRLGVFKPFLVAGVGLEFAALTTLAILAYTGSNLYSFLFALAALGLGMGVAMPTATVIVQNTIDRRVLGTATGALSFIRTLGGTLGIALSGGIMAAQLARGLTSLAPAVDIDEIMTKGMTHIAELSPEQHGAVIDAYRLAISGSFAMSGFVMFCALIMVSSLPGAAKFRRVSPKPGATATPEEILAMEEAAVPRSQAGK